MLATEAFLTNGARASTAVLLVALAGSGFATPTITGSSGSLNHKGSATITGSGFGSKPQAAPVVWDDASTGTVVTDGGKWHGYYPTQSAGSPPHLCVIRRRSETLRFPTRTSRGISPAAMAEQTIST